MIDLKATSNLIAVNAENRIFQALGIGASDMYADPTCTTTRQSEGLTIKSLESAVKMLKASDQESQERLIKLMRSIGFNIMVNPHMDEPLIILPKEYEEAVANLKQGAE